MREDAKTKTGSEKLQIEQPGSAVAASPSIGADLRNAEQEKNVVTPVKLPGQIVLHPEILPGANESVVSLPSEEFRRLLSLRGAIESVNLPSVEFPDTPLLVNKAFLEGDSGAELSVLLEDGKLFELHLSARAIQHSIPDRLLGAYRDFLSAHGEQRVNAALADLEQVSDEAALLALEESGTPASQDWSKRYPESVIHSPEEACAPVNARYLDFREAHPDPKAIYQGRHPNENAYQQKELYQELFGEGEGAASRVKQFARFGSFLLVPVKGSYIDLAPYIRSQGGVGPDYLQFSMKWGGEYLHKKGPRSSQIVYSWRWHTNTRKLEGQAPSSVIEREYKAGRWQNDRLVYPSEKALEALEHTMFKQFKRVDATGNVWIARDGAELSSQLRAKLWQAKAILEATHFPFWRELKKD